MQIGVPVIGRARQNYPRWGLSCARLSSAIASLSPRPVPEQLGLVERKPQRRHKERDPVIRLQNEAWLVADSAESARQPGLRVLKWKSFDAAGAASGRFLR